MEHLNFDIGMYIIDKDYRMLYINDAAQRMYPDVHMGDICYRALACMDHPCETCPIGKQESVFYNPIRKEWISAQAAQMVLPEYGECQNIQFILKQRRMERTTDIREESQVQSLIAELGAAQGQECIVGGYCREGYPLFYVNEQMVEMLGYSNLEELADATDGLLINVIHPDDREQVLKDVGSNHVAGQSLEIVCRVPRKNGSWIWMVVRGKVITCDNGELGFVCVCMNMTSVFVRQDRLRAQYEELERKDIMSNTMMDNMPSGYHRCEAKEGCPFIFIGRHFEELVGWTSEEIQTEFDNKYSNLVWPEDIDKMSTYDNMLKMRGHGNAYDTSIYRMKRKGGGYRWVLDSTMFVDMGEESFFQATLADITDFIEGMNDRQSRLEEALVRLEAANKAKSAFLFNVSHDVRTPMNAIQGYTHIIEQCPDDGELVRDMIGKIRKSSDTLMRLLNDVLEVSRIESGKDKLDLVPVDLNAFVEKLYLMFVQEMEADGLTFRLENGIRESLVRCDELKCTRIVMNMLSNARKFTERGGSVVMGVEPVPQETEGRVSYRFYVRDTGIGMSEEFLSRAFEEFEREKTSTDTGVIGSGLGLAIIKKLVTLMGGTYDLKSELGKGTEISATISFDLESSVPELEAEPADLHVDFSGKRVLLVEDNEFNREIARFILQNLGLDVEEASDGQAAVTMIEAHEPEHYDLVLMDVQMPVMDGYAATGVIRQMADPVRAALPIIAMTANAFKEDRDRCLEVGMNGHLGKPIDADVLMRTLSAFFD